MAGRGQSSLLQELHQLCLGNLDGHTQATDPLEEFTLRKEAVSVSFGHPEEMEKGGLRSLGGVERYADLAGYLIGGPKGDTANLATQPIGLVTDHAQRAGSKTIDELLGEDLSDSKATKARVNLPQGSVFRPVLEDSLAALLPDASNLAQPGRLPVEDRQSLETEVCDQASSHLGPESPDRSASQVSLQASQRSRVFDEHTLHPELSAELSVLCPVAP